MTQDLPAALLARFSQFVEKNIGLHFPKERWNDLERGIHGAASEFGYEDVKACLSWLMKAPLTREQIEILASHLTIGETYFFRDKQSFELLETKMLPELIRSRRNGELRLRIWSAACCTGEEAYSIALLIHKIVPDLADWNITILATDINPAFLKKASAGIFGKWSFRDLQGGYQSKYFQKTGNGHFEIAPEIKKMVSFGYLNLVEDSYPSLISNTNAMDIILCRNVLMYFSTEQAKKVSAKLCHSLVEGGWFLASPNELSQFEPDGFVPVSFPGAFVYQKATAVTTRGSAEVPVSRSVSPTKSKENPLKLSKAKVTKSATDSFAVVTKHEDANAMTAQARACANAGRLEEALTWCDKAIVADKLNHTAYYLSGVILQEQGAIDKAAEALRRALYLNHDFALAHFALGNLSRRRANHPEANRCFENTLQLLRHYRGDEVLPESEGLTAGRLSAIIESMKQGTS